MTPTHWNTEQIPDLTGKVAIVTGANSGIGFEIARALACKIATVILACRNQEKGKAAVQRIKQELKEAKVDLILIDLSNLASVHSFADEFARRYQRLDILINNAGIMATPFEMTADGFEKQFATNHLGHFALTGLLLGHIDRTVQARIITVSSAGHRFAKMDFENLNGQKRYDPQRAYSQSKLANLLFTYELDSRLERAGIDAIAAAAHPGWTATNLASHWRMVHLVTPLVGQKPQMGALPVLYAATAPDVRGGDYFGPGGWQELKGYPKKLRSSASSYDKVIAARLWTVSEELTGVRYL